MSTEFEFLNKSFDKIFVLSLPRLKDRNQRVIKLLKGLNYDFFYGVDKNDVTLQQIIDQGLYSSAGYKSFYKYPSDMNLGMLCCALGHLHIYQEIVKNNYHRTLILEDDIIPNFSQFYLLPTAMSELPPDWEILYLGYEKHEHFGWKEVINSQIKKIIPSHPQLVMSRRLYRNYYAKPYSNLLSKAGFHDCTHAYALTFEAAKKLIPYAQPVRFHPDNLLSWMIGQELLNGFIIRPKLFTQLTAFSNQLESLTAS